MGIFSHVLNYVGISCNYNGPNHISPAKVDEKHTKRGLGKLLLAASEEHSQRCLAAATHVAGLFPTHCVTPFKCWARATWSHGACVFLVPVPSTRGAHCRDERWNVYILRNWFPYKFEDMTERYAFRVLILSPFTR